MPPTFTPRTPPTAETPQPKLKQSSQKKTPAQAMPQLVLRIIRVVGKGIRLAKKLLVRCIRYVKSLPRIQLIQRIMVGLALICGIFLLSRLLPHGDTSAPAQLNTTSHSGAELPKGTPDFSTVLPTGKRIDKLGGWTRVSPSDRNPVYAYTDTLAQISIIVSEQPLPETFKTDTDAQVKQLAAGYNAERTFEVGNITVYIGKSAKGPQSLIFTAHGLLILIKSSATIPDEQWKLYIKSLQ